MANSRHVRIIKNDFARLAKASPKKRDQGLAAAAEEGVNIVKLSMNDSPSSGNTYTRGSVSHTSASPGNPPRPDTGTLLNSIRAEKVRDGVWRIFTGVEYAEYLEYGSTRWAGGITFPFMGPMAMELEKRLPDIFDGFLDE